jgi:hypothetical protein
VTIHTYRESSRKHHEVDVARVRRMYDFELLSTETLRDWVSAQHARSVEIRK